MILHYTPRGVYTVRSGYQLARDMAESSSSSDGSNCGFITGLRKLWQLRLPNKVKIHVWRLLFEVIPVRVNLIQRGVKIEVKCPSCHKWPEDIAHTFWYCQFARKAWSRSNLWIRVGGFSRGGFGDLFQWVIDHGNCEELEFLF